MSTSTDSQNAVAELSEVVSSEEFKTLDADGQRAVVDNFLLKQANYGELAEKVVQELFAKKFENLGETTFASAELTASTPAATSLLKKLNKDMLEFSPPKEAPAKPITDDMSEEQKEALNSFMKKLDATHDAVHKKLGISSPITPEGEKIGIAKSSPVSGNPVSKNSVSGNPVSGGAASKFFNSENEAEVNEISFSRKDDSDKSSSDSSNSSNSDVEKQLPSRYIIQMYSRKAGFKPKREMLGKRCAVLILREFQVVKQGFSETLLGTKADQYISDTYEIEKLNDKQLPFIPANFTQVRLKDERDEEGNLLRKGRTTLKSRKYLSILIWVIWD